MIIKTLGLSQQPEVISLLVHMFLFLWLSSTFVSILTVIEELTMNLLTVGDDVSGKILNEFKGELELELNILGKGRLEDGNAAGGECIGPSRSLGMLTNLILTNTSSHITTLVHNNNKKAHTYCQCHNLNILIKNFEITARMGTLYFTRAGITKRVQFGTYVMYFKNIV
ncbi:hypothetical protein ACJX0J_014698 [Zea mays]